jgi:hypothetical protein
LNNQIPPHNAEFRAEPPLTLGGCGSSTNLKSTEGRGTWRDLAPLVANLVARHGIGSVLQNYRWVIAAVLDGMPDGGAYAEAIRLTIFDGHVKKIAHAVSLGLTATNVVAHSVTRLTRERGLDVGLAHATVTAWAQALGLPGVDALHGDVIDGTHASEPARDASTSVIAESVRSAEAVRDAQAFAETKAQRRIAVEATRRGVAATKYDGGPRPVSDSAPQTDASVEVPVRVLKNPPIGSTGPVSGPAPQTIASAEVPVRVLKNPSIAGTGLASDPDSQTIASAEVPVRVLKGPPIVVTGIIKSATLGSGKLIPP